MKTSINRGAGRVAKAETTPGADAELLALAQKCVALGAEEEARILATDAAQELTRIIAPPKALLRTEEDLQNGLFLGRAGIGKPYDADDIALLRPLARRWAREAGNASEYEIWKRARDILEFWQDWSEEVASEEARTGYKLAQAAQFAALLKYEAAVKKLIAMRAETFEGVLAKARAYRHRFSPDEGIANDIANGMKNSGPDEDTFALDLARDLFRLAGVGEV